jgi:hypothetical protein
MAPGEELVWCSVTNKSDYSFVFLVVLLCENIKSMGWFPDVINHYESNSQVSFYSTSFILRMEQEVIITRTVHDFGMYMTSQFICHGKADFQTDYTCTKVIIPKLYSVEPSVKGFQ